ncbi:tRNA (adenosine(37)-N6)-dimethylallyltransferase MiaA [Mucilaginibacter panaciglaebae]|uniref:tRNA dimethylallyltransferase n=1 Tax=Mucilaginibacter panaciglaebae TaxID=502331 RepID=A0ABP7WU89_9SPHI
MNHQSPKTLIVIAGPTASGKTAAAISLAQHYKTVILSADSRQFYREMSIGTAKPSWIELAAAKHYFIDSHSITDNFSVGDFEKQALALLDEQFKVHDVIITVGGSGLYIKALVDGFDDIPQANPEIRERLNKELTLKGIEPLKKKLKEVDPDYYDEVDLNNPQRIIRALEVHKASGKPFSSYRKAGVNKRPFNILKIALDMPREVLYHRINQRVDVMLEQGLVAEARSLIFHRHLNALNTVGYSELFDHFDNKISLEKAIDQIKQNTRHFAKRQLTWFRKDNNIHWLKPEDIRPDVIERLLFDQA